jgi:hypothetical protein
MKHGFIKIFSLMGLILIFFSGFKSYSQFNLGIKAGLNINKFITSPDEFRSEKTKIGLVGGVFFRFQASSFSLEPQILYSQKNGEYSYSTMHNSFDSFFKSENGYLDVPVLFGVHFGKNIKLHSGPVFSFLIKEKFTFQVRDTNINIGVTDNAFKQLNFGWQFGGNIEISKLIIGVLYERSIQDVINNFKIPNSSVVLTPDLRNDLWQVTLGFKFRSK